MSSRGENRLHAFECYLIVVKGSWSDLERALKKTLCVMTIDGEKTNVV